MGFAFAFKVLGPVKIGGAVILVLIVAVRRFDALQEGRAAYRQSPATARLVLFMAIAFSGLLQFADIGAQAEDLLRRELERGPGSLLLLLEVSLYLFVVVMVSRIRLPPAVPPPAGRLILYGLGVAAAGGLLLWAGRMTGPLALGAIILVIGLGSALVAVPSADEPPDPPVGERSGRGVYAAAALLPAASLAMLAGRLFSGELATDASGGSLALLAFVAVALLSAGAGVAWYCLQGPEIPVIETDSSKRLPLSRWDRFVDHKGLAGALLVLSLAPIAVAVVGTKVDVMPTLGHWLSSFGVLLLGLTAFAATCGAARLLLADWDRPALIARLGFRSTPVVALLLIWFVVATAVTAQWENEKESPHVVRTMTWTADGPATCSDKALLEALQTTEPRPHEPAVASLLCSWLVANAKVGDGNTDTTPVPLVLVTASGGGVRAAAWTARVLDCLFLAPPAEGSDPCLNGRAGVAAGQANPFRFLFAAGGASGGSVGIVSTVAQHLAPVDQRTDSVPALGKDHVGPLLGKAVLGELTLAAIGLAPGQDRAEVLIEGWSRPFSTVQGSACGPLVGRALDDVGFLQLQDACSGQVPLMLLNGTVVRTGQRFNISPWTARRPSPTS